MNWSGRLSVLSSANPEYGGDLALFDAELVPNTGDLRSVGELLVDADWQARQLLHGANGPDAPGLVRGWPRVAAAASDLYFAMPGRQSDAQREAGEPDRPFPGDTDMKRIAETAQRMGNRLDNQAPRPLAPRVWPGGGPPDSRAVELAETFERAAALVHRYGAELPLVNPRVQADLAAARARVMHAVYVSSHGVQTAIHEHGRERVRAAEAAEAGSTEIRRERAREVARGPLEPWSAELNRTEQWAGNQLAGTDAPFGDQQPTPDRLRRALATWDAAATRALGERAMPAQNLAMITGGQQFIAGWGCTVVAASARDGALPAADALHETTEAWGNLHGRWRDLVDPTAPVDQGLVEAFGEVRAAMREVTHAGSERLDHEELQRHPGLDPAVGAVLEAALTGPDVLEGVAHHTAGAAGMEAYARGLAQRLRGDVDPTEQESAETALLDPRAVTRNDRVPVPTAIVEGIQRSADTLGPLVARSAAVADTVARPVQLSPAAKAALEASGRGLRPGEAPGASPTQGTAARVDRGTPTRRSGLRP